MDYKTIEKGLSEFNKSKVLRYINYLKVLETSKDRDNKLKNKWFAYFKPEGAIDMYKKVTIDGFAIDGETITLQFKGSVMVSYNYQAYKNKVLSVYPETLFDMQNVCEGDTFSFHKESGKVVYSHKLADPFGLNKVIIGTYCIIKNKRGEFIEILNKDVIDKIRATAKTQKIWDLWEGEMILKTGIKRACKRHFKDITANIDSLDNENYDLERVELDKLINDKIDKCETFTELSDLYKSEKSSVKDEVVFISLLGKRKEELKSLLPEITKSDHAEAIKMLESGKTINDISLIWKIDEETQQDLISKSL